LIVLALSAVLSTPAAGTQGPLPKAVHLTTPSHALQEAFTRIAGAFELPDGRTSPGPSA
jgi:hypothetical protein